MNKRVLALIAAAVAEVLDDDVVGSELLRDLFPLVTHRSDRRGGVEGRRWIIDRNDPRWSFTQAMSSDFISTSRWKEIFRVCKGIFDMVLTKSQQDLTKQVTKFRLPIEVERSTAAFFMYPGECTSKHVAAQLKIGASTVLVAVKEVSRLLCAHFKDVIKFPMDENDVPRSLMGFKKIAGLPYCVGAIDGSNIPWHRCPTEQHFFYRCYKGFTSFVVFAVCTSDCKAIYM